MSDLRLVPGIGAKKEKELIELGYSSLEELKNADPDDLYFRACAKKGWQLDKCVLYAFRCAVAFAKAPLQIPTNTVGGIFVIKKNQIWRTDLFSPVLLLNSINITKMRL